MSVTTAQDVLAGIEEKYRTCLDTGLKIYSKSEALIKVNVVTAIIFLAIGGFFGILVALTRWPGVHLLPADLFYLALTAHGAVVLLFFIIFFEIAVLYFASSVLLNCRLAAPKVAWLGYILMIVGSLLTVIAVLQGESSVMFTSYVPLKAAPHFYLGLVLFAVGALLGVMVFFGTLVIAKEEKTYEGSIPLVTFGALTAAIIAVFTLASGAIILIPTFLWSVGLIGEIDSLTYKIVWWAMGHSSQQINVATQVSIWYLIAALVVGAKPVSEKLSRTAFLLYILFLQLAGAHHLLAEPGLSSEWKIFNTSYAFYLAVVASMIHGMSIPGAVEAAQRSRGYVKGVFGWLRNAPWDNPAFSGMALSVLLFGFLGGITGVVLGTEQINLLMHNTLYVPGHFHGTVVAGTTLAFMAVSYIVVPLIFQKELILPRVAKLQPYVFALGVAGISLFMMGAGTLGVPRRHWDITFADATLSFDFPGTAFLMLGLNGISAVLAGVGGLMFVVVIVGTLIWGKQRGAAEVAANPIVLGGEVASTYGSAGTMKLPGTAVLVSIFFMAFVLYYFINWKYLSEVWPLS